MTEDLDKELGDLDLGDLDLGDADAAGGGDEPAEAAADAGGGGSDSIELDADLQAMLDGSGDEPAGDADAGGGSDDILGGGDDILAGGDEPASGGAAASAPAPAPRRRPPSAGLSEDQASNLEFLLDIKLHVTFEVGRSKMMISDLLTLGQGSVIELHRLVGDELDFLVNGKLVAKGEVVVVNEKFGCKITDIISPEDRIKHLGTI